MNRLQASVVRLAFFLSHICDDMCIKDLLQISGLNILHESLRRFFQIAACTKMKSVAVIILLKTETSRMLVCNPFVQTIEADSATESALCRFPLLDSFSSSS